MTWTNPDLRLYHGTVDAHIPSVLGGINLAFPSVRSGSDFGRGFYTTTSEHQARKWAATLSLQNRYKGSSPAVAYYEIARDAIARLECLWFVRGDPGEDDYWSLVQHFRSIPRGIDHCRTGNSPWYDVVVGHVSLNWKNRQVAVNGNQVSLHTQRAVSLFDSATKGRLP
jgi:hypothetical protein